MKKLEAVLWTGYNLEEVIEFTGKHHKFREWFKSWDEYKTYVKNHDNIFKMFSSDGFSVDVYPGTWIVKTPEGFNIPLYNCWLKSLKPQSHWKPSEENIKDLEWCADLVKEKMGVGFHRLQVFIDELKTLRDYE